MDPPRGKNGHKGPHGKFDRLRKRFKQLLGLESLIIIDPSYLPKVGEASTSKVKYAKSPVPSVIEELFHLDLFLTIGGKLSVHPPKELIFLGELREWIFDPKTKKGNWKAFEKSDSNTQTNHPQRMRMEIIFDALENIKAQLSSDGFEIVRLPLLFHGGTYYSYNNCIMEASNSKQSQTSQEIEACNCKNDSSQHQNAPKVEYLTWAYLPRFHDEELDGTKNPENWPDFKKADDEVCCIMKSHGIKPIFVDFGFRMLAHSRAGLHCITSVLRRGAHHKVTMPKSQDPH